MTTIPERENILSRVLSQIYNQVSSIRIVFNKYKEVPRWVVGKSKIIPFLDPSNKHSDCAKWKVPPKKGYVFSIDDDILYPKSYIETLISKIEEYSRTSVVTVHGARFKFPFCDFVADRKVYHFNNAKLQDSSVNMVGSGTLAYHTDTLLPRFRDFHSPNRSDIWFSALCYRKAVPIMCIARKKGWLKPIRTKGPKIWDTTKFDDDFMKVNTECVKRHILPFITKG